MNLTPKQIIEEKLPTCLTANPELQKEINAVILFDIKGENGGKWILDLTKNSDWLINNTEEVTPQITVGMLDSDFIGMITRTFHIQGLAMGGKIKMKPVNSNVMQLLKLLMV